MKFDTQSFFDVDTSNYDYENDINLDPGDVVMYYSAEDNSMLELSFNFERGYSYIEYTTGMKMPICFSGKDNLRAKLKQQNYTFIGYV